MIDLHHGDCFDHLPDIADHSIDLVIADLPFGITGCKWDCKIDLKAFWAEMERICVPNRSNVLCFGTQPFTSELVQSNPKWFKYEMIWQKHRPTGFQHCQQRVLQSHENILLFTSGALVGKHMSDRQPTYNPLGLIQLEKPIKRKPAQRVGFLGKKLYHGGVQTHTNYPRSILEFKSVHKPFHNTQKPVDLLRYLVETFSNPGDTVLDPTMGSGSTGVAARDAKRKFIGMEMDERFFLHAQERIAGYDPNK